jgi:hypothetical protein
VRAAAFLSRAFIFEKSPEGVSVEYVEHKPTFSLT